MEYHSASAMKHEPNTRLKKIRKKIQKQNRNVRKQQKEIRNEILTIQNTELDEYLMEHQDVSEIELLRRKKKKTQKKDTKPEPQKSEMATESYETHEMEAIPQETIENTTVYNIDKTYMLIGKLKEKLNNNTHEQVNQIFCEIKRVEETLSRFTQMREDVIKMVNDTIKMHNDIKNSSDEKHAAPVINKLNKILRFIKSSSNKTKMASIPKDIDTLQENIKKYIYIITSAHDTITSIETNLLSYIVDLNKLLIVYQNNTFTNTFLHSFPCKASYHTTPSSTNLNPCIMDLLTRYKYPQSQEIASFHEHSPSINTQVVGERTTGKRKRSHGSSKKQEFGTKKQQDLHNTMNPVDSFLSYYVKSGELSEEQAYKIKQIFNAEKT